MLSGETAIGKHPRLAVETMNRIAQVTERSLEGLPLRQASKKNSVGLHDITNAVVRGVGTMAQSLNAKLVVVASHSGRTALALSQQRNFSPTIGVSSKESTLRLMCLYWGVMPLRNAPAENIKELIKFTDEWACRVGMTAKGDRIVIVGGSHLTAGQGNQQMSSGVHDVVVVHEVEGLACN